MFGDPLQSIFDSLPDRTQSVESRAAKPGHEWMLVSVKERHYIEARRRKREKKASRNNRKGKSFRITPEIKRQMAKDMLENPTRAERKLRDALKDERVNFRQQEIILGYIADFYFPEKRMIVEVDGGIHALTKERDRIRDQVFRNNRIGVMRFTNDNVIQDVASVVRSIQHSWTR